MQLQRVLVCAKVQDFWSESWLRSAQFAVKARNSVTTSRTRTTSPSGAGTSTSVRSKRRSKAAQRSCASAPAASRAARSLRHNRGNTRAQQNPGLWSGFYYLSCLMEVLNRTHAVIRLQWLSVLWLAIEFAVAVVLGIKASSVALVAFGGDSAVELFSAAVVLHRFYAGEHAERNATRIAAVLLYLLAAFVLISSIASLLNPNLRAEPSYLGIGFLIAAAVIMPWLGRRQTALATITCSSALKADAAQSSICAYMSWIALGGLAINAIFHLPWVDSAAALLLIPLVLYEANEARKGHACC